MTVNNEVQVKIKLLNTRGINWLIKDLLNIVADDLDMERGPDDDMTKLVQDYTRQLRNQYKKQVTRDKLVATQTDLEDLIQTMRLENYAKIIKLENDGEGSK